MVCREPPPKCSEEGGECGSEQKCCGSLTCTKEKYGEGKTCKDVPPPPKCVEEGNKCSYDQKCCGDNLICSEDGVGGEMVCREPPPKCSEEGGECGYEQKCCGSLICTEEKYGEGKTCKDVPPPPKCVAEGDECTEEEKCCGDLTCASGKGNDGDCDLATSFNSEECKKKTCRGVDGEQECLAKGGLAKGDECDSTNGHKCCGKT